MGCCMDSCTREQREGGGATSVYDAGETFTGMLYPAINSSVLHMDVKIEKGSETNSLT